MNIRLIPKKSFDKESINTINKLVKIAGILLSKWNIPIAKNLEFYNSIDLFMKRITLDVKKYGLSKEQSVEFIKASLNSGSYGTFDIKKKSIIEFNFNPYFGGFYPSVQFLKLLIHESLHLFLYSKLDKEIYSHKFKFKNGKYCGKNKAIQLDEGFAEFFTSKILNGFDYNKIRTLPIYNTMKSPPTFEKDVGKMNINKFNNNFNKIYEKNKNQGIKIIRAEYNKIKKDNKGKILKIISFINNEIIKTIY